MAIDNGNYESMQERLQMAQLVNVANSDEAVKSSQLPVVIHVFERKKWEFKRCICSTGDREPSLQQSF